MTSHLDLRRPVVVGVDGTQHAALALDWAATEASLRQAPLVVLHAYSTDYPAARSAGPGETIPPQPSAVLQGLAEDECATAVDRVRADHPEEAGADAGGRIGASTNVLW